MDAHGNVTQAAGCVYLSSYATVQWQTGKPRGAHLIAPLASVHRTQGDEAAFRHMPLECFDWTKNRLCVWSGDTGFKDFKGGSSKLTKSVLYAVGDGSATGAFISQEHGRSIGFLLLRHDPSHPSHLAECRNFTPQLMSVLDGISVTDDTSKCGARGSIFEVQSASLKKTDRGYVIAVIVVAENSRRFLIVGALDHDQWSRWEVEEGVSNSRSMCIVTSPRGGEVRLVDCRICPPVDATELGCAATVPLALSMFERSCDELDTTSHLRLPSSDMYCVALRERTFPLDGSKAVTERSFQSQLFSIPAETMSALGGLLPCLVEAIPMDRDDTVGAFPLYALTVQHTTSSACLVQFAYTADFTNLVSSCTVLDGLRDPLSLTAVKVCLPERPEGIRLVLVLSTDDRLFACEAMGSIAFSVVVNETRSNKLPSVVASAPRHNTTDGQYKGESASRLVPLGEHEFLCSHDMGATVIRVGSLSLPANMPPVVAPPPAAPGIVVGTGQELTRCLELLLDMSGKGIPMLDIAEFVGKAVVPALRYVGNTQQESFLMQRLFNTLLELVAPTSEEAWRLMWGLGHILQRSLAKRSRDHSVVYTDQFFLSLMDQYKESRNEASNDTTGRFFDGLGSVLSAELMNSASTAVARSTVQPHHALLLDRLAEGVPLVPLCVEVVQSMIETVILSNGACVVRAKGSTGSCVHLTGAVLLASCLDVPVYLGDSDGGQMICSSQMEEPNSVYVPPRVFADQREFEMALALAADLLCIVASPSSAANEGAHQHRQMKALSMALVALSAARRTHCITTYMQLFAPLIKPALVQCGSLSDNRSWLMKCASALGKTYDELFSRLLMERDSTTICMVTLCYTVCSGGNHLRVYLYRLFASLSEEFSVGCCIVLLFSTTERLLAAQNNYSAAVMRYVLSKRPDEREVATQSISECKKRLQVVLDQLTRLWAQLHLLTPYKVQDVAASYAASVTASQASSSASTAAQRTGTVLSRTLVMCYRMYALMAHTHRIEKLLDAALRESKAEALSTAESLASAKTPAVVEGCLLALQAGYSLKDSCTPVESFQSRLLLLVEAGIPLCRHNPPWTRFFMRVLELCSIMTSSMASLKKKLYELLHQLRDMCHGITWSDACHTLVERCVERAETLTHSLTLQERNTESDGAHGSVAHFLFSHERDDTLPSWTASHHLSSRQYLISSEWTGALWPLERLAPSLEELNAHAVDDVMQRVGDPSILVDEELPGSPVLRRPLYETICLLVPPVRAHALLADRNATGRAESAVDLSTHTGAGKEAGMASPAGLNGSDELMRPARGPMEEAVTEGFTASAKGGLGAAHDHSLLFNAHRQSATPAIGSPTAASANLLGMVNYTSNKFTPDDVAWWEAVSSGGGGDQSGGGQRGEVCSDTATSYSTATTVSRYTDPVHEYSVRRQGAMPPAFCRSTMEEATLPRRPRHHCCSCRCRKHCSHKHYGTYKDDLRPAPAGDRGAASRIQLLQFTKLLQPPALPGGTKSTPVVVQTARAVSSSVKRTPPPLLPRCAVDSNGQLPLLHFRMTAERREPRVRLYTACNDMDDGGVPSRLLQPTDPIALRLAPPPFLDSAASRASPRYLQPPPLPSSAVFQEPPTLLQLPRSDAAMPSGPRPTPSAPAPSTQSSWLPVHSPGPAAETVRHDTATQEVPVPSYIPSSVPLPHAVRSPSVDVPPLSGAYPPPTSLPGSFDAQPGPLPPTPTRYHSAPGGGGGGGAAPQRLPIPTLQHSVLTPSEHVGFSRYVDELRAKGPGAAASSPKPAFFIPDRGYQFTSQAPPVVPSVAPSSLGQAHRVPFDGQETFLRTASAALKEHEAANEACYRRITEAVRSGLSSSSPRPRMEGGLSSEEQAVLLRHTIQQKNELLNLNHNLLDLQLHAARSATGLGSPVSATTALPQSPLTKLWPQPSLVTHTAGSLVGAARPQDGALQKEDHLPSSSLQRSTVRTVGETAHTFLTKRDASTEMAQAPAPHGPFPLAAGDTHSNASMANTLLDLQKLNSHLLGMNASADAMENAIRETREAIQQYERWGSMDRVAAEGHAMMHVMRSHTEATERRLNELTGYKMNNQDISLDGTVTVPTGATQEKEDVPSGPSHSYFINEVSVTNLNDEEETSPQPFIPTNASIVPPTDLQVTPDRVNTPRAGTEVNTEHQFPEAAAQHHSFISVQQSPLFPSPACVGPEIYEDAPHRSEYTVHAPSSWVSHGNLPTSSHSENGVTPSRATVDVAQLYHMAGRSPTGDKRASHVASLRKKSVMTKPLRDPVKGRGGRSVSATARPPSSGPRRSTSVSDRFSMYLPTTKASPQQLRPGRLSSTRREAVAEPATQKDIANKPAIRPTPSGLFAKRQIQRRSASIAHRIALLEAEFA